MQATEAFRALHKCWYPCCVGQAGAAWVVSTLGSNILLSALHKRKDKYIKIHRSLQGNETCKIKTSLFSTRKFSDTDLTFPWNDISKSMVNFTKGEGAQAVNQWVCNQHSIFNEFNVHKIIPSDSIYVAANVCIFESTWRKADSDGRVMKVHNTFNYTQAVNYEARILELPMREDDFRVIVLLPNEEDLLNTLFRRLTKDGLAASFASLQPLFSVKYMLNPPICTISSQTNFSLDESKKGFQNESLVQYGAISIDSEVVRAYALSCLFSTESKPDRPRLDVKHKEEKPYFFAITYCDSPIFTGQYIPSMT